MLVCAVHEALVDLGKDHDDFVFLDVRDRFVVNDFLVELYQVLARILSNQEPDRAAYLCHYLRSTPPVCHHVHHNF